MYRLYTLGVSAVILPPTQAKIRGSRRIKQAAKFKINKGANTGPKKPTWSERQAAKKKACCWGKRLCAMIQY